MPNRLLERNNITRPKRIIGFAGTKQSGKNWAADFVGGMLLYSYCCIDKFQLVPGGILIDDKPTKINDVAPKFLKVYHWADQLKEICVDLFNIDKNLVYGSDKDKDTLTDLHWEDMPGVMTNKLLYNFITKTIKKKGELLGPDYQDNKYDLIYHESGRMTVREVLQYFGTDICRKMYNPCWISALEKRILKERPQIALIADTRFDNECVAIKEWGGWCIKMQRRVIQDNHSSEKGIKLFNKWDAVVNNQNTNTVAEFCELLHNTLKPVGVFNEIE